MSSQTAERMASRYQVPLAIGIVVLSIVLPFAMVCWSALAEMRDKGIAGSPSKVARYYLGSVQQGELWHAEMRLSSNLSAAPSECRILRLNLETGVEHDTGLKTPREFGRPQWMGGTLYFVTQAGIFRREGNEFAKLVTLPPPGSFHSSVFLWEGQLTMIRPDDDGGFRLVHVSDGEWINGRPILLPDATRVWYDDPQRGRRVLLPLTLQQPVSIKTPVGLLAVEVVEHGQQHHVMVSDYNNFSAFRTGVEFADEPHAGVSALAPENAPRDVSGWEPISPAQANGNRTWMGMAASRDGLLFLSWDEPMKVARRKPEGTWEWFDFQREGERRGVYWFASDPASAHTYFIGADPRWGSAEVRRIEGRTVHPAARRHSGRRTGLSHAVDACGPESAVGVAATRRAVDGRSSMADARSDSAGVRVRKPTSHARAVVAPCDRDRLGCRSVGDGRRLSRSFPVRRPRDHHDRPRQEEAHAHPLLN